VTDFPINIITVPGLPRDTAIVGQDNIPMGWLHYDDREEPRYQMFQRVEGDNIIIGLKSCPVRAIANPDFVRGAVKIKYDN